MFTMPARGTATFGMPLSETILYLLQYDHVIPATDARHLINTYYYYYYYYYYLLLDLD